MSSNAEPDVNEVVVTAVGADRPGIVAALTGALLEVGGDLADVRAARWGERAAWACPRSPRTRVAPHV